ncbi:hypothetical protein [Herpetosiphon geysericola]|uniref:Crystallin n=1 Tax=Herpetosiphon geysericola TaxID=70996 RepID=A0A0P6YA03_9CHLR|nr:hypothetical protein [Herpetosiphon geysericola]KPL86068.1 crystallin [Herpetosiphon geysericola]
MNNSTPAKQQICPICDNAVQPMPRYPRYVCAACVALATDQHGRGVQFFNTGLMGTGCAGSYRADQAAYPSDQCWINGQRCCAKEARFGGIVIEVVDDE